VKPLALALAALVASGCAAALDEDRQRDGRCLYAVGRPHAVGGDFHLYKAHRRVPGDDLLAATADVPAAYRDAEKARLDEWLGLGSLVLGPVLFVPGVGVFGYGLAKGENGATGGGAVLALTGVAGIVAGAILYTRADRERARAIDTYNQERAASCRP
jgi:hypothetical protein